MWPIRLDHMSCTKEIDWNSAHTGPETVVWEEKIYHNHEWRRIPRVSRQPKKYVFSPIEGAYNDYYPIQRAKDPDGRFWFRERDYTNQWGRWYPAPGASGYFYCEVCFKNAQMEIVLEGTKRFSQGEFTSLTFEDGEPLSFWRGQCKKCRVRKSRFMASINWQEALTLASKMGKSDGNLRLVTLTIKDPIVGFNKLWELPDEIQLQNYTVSRNGIEKEYTKFTGEWCDLSLQDDDEGSFTKMDEMMRKKLRLRLKNIRTNKTCKGYESWNKYVDGGVAAYEMVIRVDREKRTIAAHPHLHLIIVGRKFPQKELTEAWGLGHCDIRIVKDEAGARHEISKYVGKDGSRRAAFGSARKARAMLLSQKRE